MSSTSAPSQNVVFNGTYVYFKPCEFKGVVDANGSIDLTFNIGRKETEIFSKVANNLCQGEPIVSTPLWTNPKNDVTSVKAKIFKPADHTWSRHMSSSIATEGYKLCKEDILQFYNQACRVTGTMRKNKQGNGGWTLYFQSMELNPGGECIPYSVAPPVDFDTLTDASQLDMDADVVHEPITKPPTNPRKPVKINPTRIQEDDETVEDSWSSTKQRSTDRVKEIKVKSKRATTPAGDGSDGTRSRAPSRDQ